MSLTAMDVLLWARGPLFVGALVIFLFGIVLRLFEIFSLGRKPDFSSVRSQSKGSGWRTVFTRSLPYKESVVRAPITVIGGFVFHFGFFITLLFFVPHIQFIAALTSLSWPGLPSVLIDLTAVLTLIALLLMLINRLLDPVKRFLSTAGDYWAWLLTVLPVLSGYLATHHLLLDYTWMLALHILSVELLMVMLPFTKLMHALSFVIARWYTGEQFGRKGVVS